MNTLRLFFTSAFLSCISLQSIAQSAAKENYYKADSLLKLLVKEYGNNSSFKYKTEGTEYIYGHYSTPEQADTCPLKGNMAGLNKGTVLVQSDMIYAKKPYQSSTLFFADSCYFVDYGETKIARLNKTDLLFVCLYSPNILIQAMLSNKASLHCFTTKDKLNIIGFNDKAGNKYYVSITNKGFISRLEKFVYDDIYGDVTEELLYENYKKLSTGGYIAEHVVHKKSGLVQRDLNFSVAEFAIDSSLIKEQLKYNPGLKDEKNLLADITVDEVGKGLYLLKLNKQNNKVLVAEYKDYLAVIEAPLNLQTGRDIIARLKEKFPSKPVKYCFLGHHHPDHAGAIPAFMEINAQIISTKGNLGFYKKITAGKHSLNSGQDELVLKGYKGFETIDLLSSKTYFPGENAVQALEFGKNTSHTNEFLAFYFKNEKILFVGDLVLFPEKGIRDQGQRAYSVFQLIKDNKLDVNKIYTSWPLHNFRDFGTMQDLQDCIKKSHPEVN
jgi:glyoxylase-like metal-dependent hydrolase (beta-lactamase superfamily II)